MKRRCGVSTRRACRWIYPAPRSLTVAARSRSWLVLLVVGTRFAIAGLGDDAVAPVAPALIVARTRATGRRDELAEADTGQRTSHGTRDRLRAVIPEGAVALVVMVQPAETAFGPLAQARTRHDYSVSVALIAAVAGGVSPQQSLKAYGPNDRA